MSDHDVQLTPCNPVRFGGRDEGAPELVECYYVTVDGRDGGMLASEGRGAWITRSPEGDEQQHTSKASALDTTAALFN